MKKLVSLILACLLTLTVAACGSSGDKDVQDPGSTPYKIALVCPQVGSDRFVEDAVKGLNAAGEKYGKDKVETILCECSADADYEENMRACVAEGVDLLIGLSWQAGNGIDAVAKDFPDACEYVLIDSTVDNENVSCVSFYDAEGAYLIGVMAGLICDSLWEEGDEHVYGQINVTQSASSWQWRYAFYEGVLSIDPQAKFTQNYVLGYTEVNLCHDYATQMAELGCKFVNDAASGGYPGTFEAAMEKGFYTSGQVVDLTTPDNPWVVSSQIKDTFATMEFIIDKFMEEGHENWKTENFRLGVAEGAIGAVHVTHESENPVPDILTTEDIALLKDIAAKIADETLEINLKELPLEDEVGSNYTLVGFN